MKTRQTNLSLGQLLEELNNPSSRYPRCFIINEIGGVCFEGNTEDRKQAEQVLVKLLRDRKEEAREIVFAYLSVIEYSDPETAVALEEFKIDPANQIMVKMMQPQIERFKANK